MTRLVLLSVFQSLVSWVHASPTRNNVPLKTIPHGGNCLPSKQRKKALVRTPTVMVPPAIRKGVALNSSLHWAIHVLLVNALIVLSANDRIIP